MKKKTKKIIALSLTATLCGAAATFAAVAEPASVSANTVSTFKMADGAGIRYTSEDGKKEGLRFIVLADETTKNAIVNSGKLGVIISIAEDFAGIDGDYLNKLDDMSYETKSELTDSTALADMFYQNTEEYGDLYCANIVINMNDRDTVENFTERTYSAVAYYPTGEDTYAYATNRQERSIQQVASMLYMAGDSDWEKVKTTYTAIGSEATPFIVDDSGDNSFDKLVENLAEDSDFGADYEFELTDNVSVDSKILDGANASDITATLASTGTSIQTNVSFDETKKYDSQSNGSYKLETTTNGTTEVANNNMNLSIDPAFDKANYQAMQLVGYDYIAIRFMIEEIASSGTVRLDYVNLQNTSDEMYIYHENEAKVSKAASYTFWDSNLKTVPTGEWAEMVLDIEKFVNNAQDGMPLLHICVNKESTFDMTMYIDNVYAVKGFIGETKETVYQDKGTSYTSDEMICTATLDGREVTVTDNEVSLDSYGVYSIKQTTRDTYGYVEQTVIPNGTVVSYAADNFSAKHIINASGVATDYTATMSDDNIIVSSGGAGKVSGVSMTTYAVKTVGDKTYYEALRTAGYAYITYEYTLSFTGQSDTYDMMAYGFVTGDYKHRNEMTNTSFPYQYTLNGGSVTNSKNTTTSYGHYINTSYPNSLWNGKKFVVSIPIQTVIDNYASTMRILALYFNAAATGLDYSVTFGQIAATKEACVFD